VVITDKKKRGKTTKEECIAYFQWLLDCASHFRLLPAV